MKKNISFATLFPYNLALITHDATNSMNPFFKSVERGKFLTKLWCCVGGSIVR